MARAGTRWGGDEIALLIQSVSDHGKHWSEFAHLFNGRSTDSMRKKYRQLLADGLVPAVAAGLNQHGVDEVFDLNQHPEEDEQLLHQEAVNPAPAPEQEVNPASALLTGLLDATSGQGEEAQAAENIKQALISAIKIVVRRETSSENGFINKAIKDELNRQQGGL